MVSTMTEMNLMSAFAGESQANMRYSIYSKRAKDAYPNISRLFDAIAFAERVHAGNHYKNISKMGESLTLSAALFGSRTTSEDLQHGINGEQFEVNEMYPSYMKVAKLQNENAAEISFRWAWEAEKTHAAFYQRALEAVKRNRDLELDDVCICSICGYTLEGEPPDHCPICNAKKKNFRVFP